MERVRRLFQLFRKVGGRKSSLSREYFAHGELTSPIENVEAAEWKVPSGARTVLLGDGMAANWPKNLLPHVAFGKTANLGRTKFGLEHIYSLLMSNPLNLTNIERAIIFAGTYNIIEGDDQVDICQATSEIVKILKLQKPSIKIYVFSILPMGPKNRAFKRSIHYSNELLKSTCLELGCAFVDVHHAFRGGDLENGGSSLFDEGLVLPSERGYACLRDAAGAAVRRREIAAENLLESARSQ